MTFGGPDVGEAGPAGGSADPPEASAVVAPAAWRAAAPPARQAGTGRALPARQRPAAAAVRVVVRHPAVLLPLSLAAVGAYALALAAAGASPPGGAASVAALFAVLLAAALSSVAGFAFSAICGALLLHLVDDHVRVVQILIVCSIGIQALSVWSLRRDLEIRMLAPFLLGGLATLPLGLHLLLSLARGGYAAVMGIALVGYGGWMLLRRPIVLPRGRHGFLGDVLAGAAGGITGGLAGFPGALVTIWCSMQGWPKEHQRGVYQPFILAMQLAALLGIELMAGREGAAARLDLGVAAVHLLPALLGTMWGLSVFRRLSERQFGVAVSLLLLVSGACLLV